MKLRGLLTLLPLILQATAAPAPPLPGPHVLSIKDNPVRVLRRKPPSTCNSTPSDTNVTSPDLDDPSKEHSANSTNPFGDEHWGKNDTIGNSTKCSKKKKYDQYGSWLDDDDDCEEDDEGEDQTEDDDDEDWDGSNGGTHNSGNATDVGNTAGNSTQGSNGTDAGVGHGNSTGSGNSTDTGNGHWNGTGPGNPSWNQTQTGNGTGAGGDHWNGTDTGQPSWNQTQPGNSTDPGTGHWNSPTLATRQIPAVATATAQTLAVPTATPLIPALISGTARILALATARTLVTARTTAAGPAAT